ncbi:MAG: hypothetical protein AAGK37_16775 [Pseudomonadota bacterium]
MVGTTELKTSVENRYGSLSVSGFSETDARRIGRLREAELRYMRDSMEAARIFSAAGRPRAVDRFIGQCLAAARRARRLARRLEDRAVARMS